MWSLSSDGCFAGGPGMAGFNKQEREPRGGHPKLAQWVGERRHIKTLAEPVAHNTKRRDHLRET